MDITLTFMDRAEAKARPRFNTRTGHAYTPTTTRRFENQVAVAFKYRMFIDKLKPTDKPVRVIVNAYFKPPQSASKAFKNTISKVLTYYDKKPDADNIMKAVLDACNGIVFVDDKQCSISCSKYYALRDYFTVRITDELDTEAQSSILNVVNTDEKRPRIL